MKVLHSMSANLENSAVATGLEKVCFHSNPKESQCQKMFKLLRSCTHFTLAKLCSKFSRPGFNSTCTVNFQMFKKRRGFRKGRGTKDQITNIHWIIKKQESSRKNIYFCLIDHTKAFDCVDHTKCRKFFKIWEYQTTLPVS